MFNWGESGSMEGATPGVVAPSSVLLGGDSVVRAFFAFLGFKCFFRLGPWSLYSLSEPTAFRTTLLST